MLRGYFDSRYTSVRSLACARITIVITGHAAEWGVVETNNLENSSNAQLCKRRIQD